MYKAKKGDSFYVGLKCLEAMWMLKQDPREEGPFAYLVRTIVGLTFVTFFQIGPTLHIVMVAIRYKNINMSEALCHIVGGLGFILVYFKILANHHSCSVVFKSLVDHKKFGKPRTFDATKIRCRLLALFLVVYCPTGVVIYGALVAYENRSSICVKLQEETDQNLYCALLFPLWFPVKISRSVIFTIQILISIELYTPGGQMSDYSFMQRQTSKVISPLCVESIESINLTSFFKVCLLIYESTFLLISHIDFLMDHLDAAFCEEDERKRFWMLRYCAEYHMHISKMGKDICTLHETFTGHLAVIWAVCFGCICNQILQSKLLGAFLYLLGYLFTCCCFVEAGQTLLIKSGSIADKLYNIPWYLGTIKEQKSIMFMIRRAQIPMKLSATPFGNYDCGFFIMIIKTAYSYLTLLQNSL